MNRYLLTDSLVITCGAIEKVRYTFVVYLSEYSLVELVEVVKRRPNCQCPCKKTQIEQINMAELSLCDFVVLSTVK